VIRSALLLAVVVVLMASTRSFLPAGSVAPDAGVALGFGFLVLAAVQAGNLFAGMRLPRLTGYLLCGLAMGPEAGGLLTPAMVTDLRLVSGVAIGLIALTAGSELNLRALRPRLRSVLLISLCALPLALVACTLLAWALAPHLPFLAPLAGAQRWTAALTLGVILASLSPAVAIAILTETASAGPLSEVTLGVVVIADLFVIVLFTSVSALGASVFGGAGEAGLSPFTSLAIEIFGSAGVGVLVALALAAVHRYARGHLALFILAACVVAAEVGSRLHLDSLIICLTAGVLLENVLGVGGAAISRALAPASLPIFAVFFALAGARLHLHDLRTLWPLALAFALARAASLMGGARLGAALAKADPAVRAWGPLGMVPQAGVSVGLAELVARHHPTWGPGARGLLLAVVTVNELVGPVLLRFALTRAGEAGRREGDAPAAEH
jgi:Kef-type K+ transport system membrane component KefB